MKEIALRIVKSAFDNKTDLAGRPYINHLENVAENVKVFVADSSEETAVVVALLHDLIEDCPEWKLEHLQAIFGKEISNAVDTLTHKRGQSYHDYIAQVINNDLALFVKIADLRDNMNITRLKSLDDKDFERLRKYHNAYTYLMDIYEYGEPRNHELEIN